jgi:hypothetical protein
LHAVRQFGFFGTRQFYFQNFLANRRLAFDYCALGRLLLLGRRWACFGFS